MADINTIRLNGVEADIADAQARADIAQLQTSLAEKADTTALQNVATSVSTNANNISTNTNNIATNAQSIASINEELADMFTTDAGSHNAVYRGKYLGDSVTDDQYSAIADGTFTDLYVGDYWTIGGVNYRIADFDYYYMQGDTRFSKHHIVIVPDTSLTTTNMNDTNTTSGAYINSRFYTETLPTIRASLQSIFGDHLTTHRIYLPNASSGSSYTAGGWFDSDVDLMTEVMVYGTVWWGTKYYYVEKRQLSLFQHRADLISNNIYHWLRDITSSTTFAYAGSSGLAYYGGASLAYGVRPAFVVS